VGEPVHGVCGACGSGITVEDGFGRNDADLLAGPAGSVRTARAAIVKAKGEA
jgi:hypothetical protein